MGTIQGPSKGHSGVIQGSSGDHPGTISRHFSTKLFVDPKVFFFSYTVLRADSGETSGFNWRSFFFEKKTHEASKKSSRCCFSIRF